uniref:Uncharacterized protein n=1 Tax=Ditylenchus dipsaci TaxID=166011 RepID=A0A915CR12_9BILA
MQDYQKRLAEAHEIEVTMISVVIAKQNSVISAVIAKRDAAVAKAVLKRNSDIATAELDLSDNPIDAKDKITIADIKSNHEVEVAYIYARPDISNAISQAEYSTSLAEISERSHIRLVEDIAKQDQDAYEAAVVNLHALEKWSVQKESIKEENI